MYRYYNSFREVYNKIVKELTSKVRIGNAELWDSLNKDFVECQALWDTGSTNSIINIDLVKELKLASLMPTALHLIGKTKPEMTYVYLIDMIFPNNVLIKNFRVIGRKMVKYDMILGMDIIQIGDFSISNSNSKTLFSFCLPPLEDRIDLTFTSKRINKINQSRLYRYLRILRKFIVSKIKL